MRIWYQSSTVLGKDPKWGAYEKSLKRHVQEIARQGTKVDVYGVEVTHPLRERSQYVTRLHQAQIINNAISAEREGYDAFCVGCAQDPGFLEIPGVISIPVAFLSQSCFHLASLLADRFSVLALGREALLRQQEMIKRYSLEERYVASTPLNLSMSDLPAAFKNPAPIIAAVKEASRSAIENGAGMLISGCNMLNMVMVDGGLKEIDGMPILDTAGVLVKVGEFMVELRQLGLYQVVKGQHAPLTKDELDSARKVYQPT